jgi:ribose transport system ATP-binding protein
MRALCGVEKRLSGDVYVRGEKVTINNPSDAMKYGIGFLTEDRRADGLATQLSIKTNINMNSYEMISKKGIISLKAENDRAVDYSKRVNVKTPSVMQLVCNLSGGNQQKVVIAKLLCCNPDVLIFDEPTVGVDVGAKEEIYKLMESLTKQGKSIILISSYLPEVMGLSDRLIVMTQGKITGEFDGQELTGLKEEDVLKRASVEG